jgi:hypothetical protein
MQIQGCRPKLGMLHTASCHLKFNALLTAWPKKDAPCLAPSGHCACQQGVWHVKYAMR